MWIDPERQMFVILLTNRVHAARALRPAKVISDVRADLSDAAVLAVLDGPQVAGGKRTFRADREVGWNPAPRRISKRRHSSSRRATIARSSRVRTAKKKATSSKSTRAKKPVKKTTKKS
jgi:CubicO group peptidase (beta-lactamase class C family)